MSSSVAKQPKQCEKPRALLLFDGQCEFCKRCVATGKRLDWLGRITFQDARDAAQLPKTDPPLEPIRLMEEMHLVTPDRCRVYHGFGAFRWMAWRLLLLVPLAPFLYIPGVLPVGQRIYLWIAKNRYNLVPCSHVECQIPTRSSTGSPADPLT